MSALVWGKVTSTDIVTILVLTDLSFNIATTTTREILIKNAKRAQRSKRVCPPSSTSTYVEGERLVLRELDEQAGVAVVAQHGLGLVVQATGRKRLEEVGYALAFNAYFRRQDEIANLYLEEL